MFLYFSAKKVECAKHQWIHLVGDQPDSPQAFEKFVINARCRSTWVRVYISLTVQSSYKPSMHFTMTCTTTHNGGPPGVLTVGTCSWGVCSPRPRTLHPIVTGPVTACVTAPCNQVASFITICASEPLGGVTSGQKKAQKGHENAECM